MYPKEIVTLYCCVKEFLLQRGAETPIAIALYVCLSVCRFATRSPYGDYLVKGAVKVIITIVYQ